MRQGLADPQKGSDESSALPDHAEAVVDPKRFEVADAVGRAKEKGAGDMLREAAKQVDRARGRLRTTDPEEALDIWKGLVEGRWSLVDWFDSDGRRYILAHPNPPRLRDPRGLSEREVQVCTYAALGESNKLIGYRLGLSPSRVSNAVRSAMRKLGVQNRAQLVDRFRAFESLG